MLGMPAQASVGREGWGCLPPGEWPCPPVMGNLGQQLGRSGAGGTKGYSLRWDHGHAGFYSKLPPSLTQRRGCLAPPAAHGPERAFLT